MVYSNKFVLSILVDGQPQKELANGTVNLAFGQEYALRLRNKNNLRAVVHLLVDGETVSGAGYVVPANGHVDIKRHHDIDRAFKFVSLDSAEAVDFGKNGPNPDKVKGTIEARFHLEKESPPKPVEHHHHHHHDHYPWYPPRPIYPYQPHWMSSNEGNSRGVLRSKSIKSSNIGGQSAGPMPTATFAAPVGGVMLTGGIMGDSANFQAQNSLAQPDIASYTSSLAPPKDGCTVEGNLTGQTFSTVWIETEETFTVLKVFLQGYPAEETVAKVRPTNKDNRITDLESENEALRQKLAEIENAKLKEELKAKTKKPRKKLVAKK